MMNFWPHQYIWCISEHHITFLVLRSNSFIGCTIHALFHMQILPGICPGLLQRGSVPDSKHLKSASLRPFSKKNHNWQEMRSSLSTNKSCFKDILTKYLQQFWCFGVFPPGILSKKRNMVSITQLQSYHQPPLCPESEFHQMYLLNPYPKS